MGNVDLALEPEYKWYMMFFTGQNNVDELQTQYETKEKRQCNSAFGQKTRNKQMAYNRTDFRIVVGGICGIRIIPEMEEG
jgi:hypothetical protein